MADSNIIYRRSGAGPTVLARAEAEVFDEARHAEARARVAAVLRAAHERAKTWPESCSEPIRPCRYWEKRASSRTGS